MDNIVLPQIGAEVALTWQWRSKDGRRQYPKNMETSHLFNTLRMIWNHTMPQSAKTHHYIRYAFGPTYTREYLLTAVALLTLELSTRGNLTFEHKSQLDHMLDWLKRNQISQDKENYLVYSNR